MKKGLKNIFLFILSLAMVVSPFVAAFAAEDAITQTIENVTDYLANIALVVAVLFFVVAGVLFIYNGGDTKKLDTAKNMILYALVGVAIVLLAKGFVSIVRSLVPGD
ncbi:MAG: TrbC/VirB2 family protein [Candidatus Pacebacteria bacterium]|nr:TrbC/VirB2 family protein [Candidatus Paceibacterota bacterium]